MPHCRQAARPFRFFTGLVLAAALLALPSLGWSATASADYAVEVCTEESDLGDGLKFFFEESGNMFLKACGVGGAGLLTHGVFPATFEEAVSGSGNSHWELTAPPGTTISELELEQSFSHTTVSFLNWALATGTFENPRTELAGVRDDRPLPGASRVTYQVHFPVVTAALFCATQFPCFGGEFTVSLKNMIAVMKDPDPPANVEVAELPGAVRGTVNVPYSATDSGSGISHAALVIDEIAQPGVHDSNGGKCDPPYHFLAPCRLSVNSSLALDTTRLSEGRHDVRVVVEDADGGRTTSNRVTLTVHNAPTSTGRPGLAGAPKVGAQLTATAGRWDGSPTKFAFQWLRCPTAVTSVADLAGCAQIPSATSLQYAPAAADVHQHDLIKVTATNASGSESAISAPSDAIAEASSGGAPPPPHKTGPVLSHVSLSRKRFRVQKGLAANEHRGTLLSFTSSKPGNLLIVIARVHPHRKPKPVGKLAATIKAGRSAVPLSGTIGKKTLAPGDYEVTISVRDASGTVSEPAHCSFKILRG